MSEIAKLTLIGYYLLDLEQHLSSFTHSPLYQNLFSKGISFFAQEDFSLDEASKIRRLWENDKRMADIDERALRELAKLINSDNGGTETATTTAAIRIAGQGEGVEAEGLPLTTRADVARAKEALLKQEWGQYRFNALVLAKKRYDLLVEVGLGVLGGGGGIFEILNTFLKSPKFQKVLIKVRKNFKFKIPAPTLPHRPRTTLRHRLPP